MYFEFIDNFFLFCYRKKNLKIVIFYLKEDIRVIFFFVDSNILKFFSVNVNV